MARKEALVKVRLRAQATWEHLARLNLSQNELASRLGVTSGYLSQLINGHRNPSAPIRRRLLEIIPSAMFDDLFVVERRAAEHMRQADVSDHRATSSRRDLEQPCP